MLNVLRVGGLCLLLSSFLSANYAFAKPIRVTSVSDLDFGIGVPGDSVKIIAAGTSETATNASFLISGDANTAFTISIPSTGTLKTTGNVQIAITSFTSYPANTSVLDSTGQKQLFVGATRAALPMNQKAGTYTGTFAITVVY